MSVNVDVKAVVRLWAGDGNREHVWLLLEGAGDPVSRTRLAAVIQETNEALSDWLDDDLQPTFGRPPLDTEAGAVWEVECFHREGPRRWLVEFAGRLEAAGFSGDVQARPYPKVGRLDLLNDGQAGRSAAIVLAPSGWSVVNRKAIVPSWKIDQGQVPALIDLVMRFLDDEPSRLLLSVGTHSEVSRGALGSLLSEALTTPDGDEPLVFVKQFGPSVNRCASFDRHGRVLLTTVADEKTLVQQVRRACDLAIRWALRCDWIVLLENSLSPSYDNAYRNARGTKLPREVVHGRGRDVESLPDAFPWAVLSSTQLPPSLDRDRWDVTPIDDGRFVVATKDLPAWFAGTEALLEARGDWAIGSERA